MIVDSNNPDPKAVLMAAYYEAPIVYVEGGEVPPETEAFIKENKDKFTKAIIYAGISDEAKAKVETLLLYATRASQGGFAVSGRSST